MPIYHKLGNLPQKRHVVFQSENKKHYYDTFRYRGVQRHVFSALSCSPSYTGERDMKSYSVVPDIRDP